MPLPTERYPTPATAGREVVPAPGQVTRAGPSSSATTPRPRRLRGGRRELTSLRLLTGRRGSFRPRGDAARDDLAGAGTARARPRPAAAADRPRLRPRRLGADRRAATSRLDLLGLTLCPGRWPRRAAGGRRGVDDRVRVEEADFTASGLVGGTFDGAWAIESACHDAGEAKEGFAREAARLLRPGARLVVADGFLIGPGGDETMSARCGALPPHLPPLGAGDLRPARPFVAALRRHGFEEVTVEDVSWRIVPLVAHIPWVTAKFLAGELVRERLRMSAVRWGHVLACILAPVLGMARHRFRYCLVTARRAAR